MYKLALTALAAAVLLAAPADAKSWERHGTFTGSHGRTFTANGSGSCSGGACSREVLKTGPNGKTLTKDVDLIKTAPGSFEREVTKTGPNGGTTGHTGTWTVTR